MPAHSKKMITRPLFLALVMALTLIMLPVSGRSATIRHERDLMSTPMEVLLCGPDKKVLEMAAQAAFRAMEVVEKDMSPWRKGSAVSKINSRAALEPVEVNPELFGLLQRCLSFSGLSRGCFDISTYCLADLWNLRDHNFRVPDPETVKKRLHLVDFRRIRMDPEAGSVFLEQQGMKISLGGIGKGYAVDKAVAAIRPFGVKGGIVNGGGDLRAFGSKETGELWTVGIRNPRDERKMMCVIPLSNVAVATSGDYERFQLVQGQRYHHILDPRTGYPAKGCMSVTIIAKDALAADALATAVFVMGPKDGLEFVETIPATEAIIINREGKLVMSSGQKVMAGP